MARCFVLITLIGGIVLLSSCATSPPPKAPQATLSPSIMQQLKNQSLASRLPVPVQHVQRNELQDTWGAARGNGRHHEGIDIMAKRGTKVFSTTDGLVADLRNNNLGGKVIWILGPAGSWHYYAHLDQHKRGLSVGDYVKKGDFIGYVGNTGNARHTSPHLHYGIYLQGKGRGAVNPYHYLR